MYWKDYIKEQIQTHSIIFGKEFKLSSGKTSNVYCDTKKVTLKGCNLSIITEILWELLNTTILDKTTKLSQLTFAGVPTGGQHLASIMARDELIDVIHIRSQTKEHGTKKIIEYPNSIKDKKVILFEDVVTTGKSILNTIEILNNEGFYIIGIIALVDRRENKESQINNVPFYSLFALEELLPKEDPRKTGLKNGLRQLTSEELERVINYSGEMVLDEFNYHEGKFCPLAVGVGFNETMEEPTHEKVFDKLTEMGYKVYNTRGINGEFYTDNRLEDLITAAREVLNERIG